jgi:hypothetical protein
MTPREITSSAISLRLRGGGIESVDLRHSREFSRRGSKRVLNHWNPCKAEVQPLLDVEKHQFDDLSLEIQFEFRV